MRYWSHPVRPGRACSASARSSTPRSPPTGGFRTPGRAATTSSRRFGREIDSLFVIILWITGIVFIGTQIVLVWAAWRFVDRPGRVATYFHGSQRLEVIWTIIPAAILVFIALYQMGTWAEIKFRSRGAQGPAAGGDHRRGSSSG